MDEPRSNSPGRRLREALAGESPLPFLGVYDAFSASLAARHGTALFLSGFGFAAGHYGLPDMGFITWTDMLAYVERLRTLLPRHHLLVDIDDGYGDSEVACHVVGRLERAGASGVVLEDQRRPRRCGHVWGKQILELEEYLEKLERVLRARRELVVVARTDASREEEVLRRVTAFAAAGADVVLADGLADLETLNRISRRVNRPLAFNQLAGGKSPRATLAELRARGVTLVIYSTPCLFAAQQAIESALTQLLAADGLLPTGGVELTECQALLQENLARAQAHAEEAPPLLAPRVKAA